MAILEKLTACGFQVKFLSHAQAILSGDFPAALTELEAVLLQATVPIEEIVGSGGGETRGTQRLRRSLAKAGWQKVNFEIKKVINGVPRESQSHEVDHVRAFPAGQLVALEIEWNNKDPFFDRDLENFKRLHAEGAISVGIIVTRGASLQASMRALVKRFAVAKQLANVGDLAKIGLSPTARQLKTYETRMKAGAPFTEAWSGAFVQDKFGAATTHWAKLDDRVNRGVGNPCPLLLIGLPDSIVTFDEPAAEVEALLKEGAPPAVEGE